jgi:hypothetical protein
VIDLHGWRAAFAPDERHNFGVDSYLRYLDEVKRLSNVLGWTPQEVDLALWEFDRRHNN